MESHLKRLLATLLFIVIYGCSCGGKDSNKQQNKIEETSKVKIQPLSLNLYIENSGSMLGYDGPQNGGQFKSVIANIYNSFSRVDGVKAPSISYVNESIEKYNGDFGTILTNNIFNLDKNNKSKSTDFKLIFDQIIKKTDNNTVSVLFSDLIYSGPNNAKSSVENLLSTAENLTATTFNSCSKTHSVLIVKFNGDYNGGYYPFNSPAKAMKYIGKRPFYMVLIAKNQNMIKFLTDSKYAKVSNFAKYQDFENLIFFSSAGMKDAPKYSILYGDPKNNCSFTTGGKKSEIHDIYDLEPPLDSQKPRLAIGVALPVNVFSKSEVDVAHFEVNSIKDKFKIIGIDSLKNRTDGLTHKIVLEAQSNAKGEREVEIKLRNQGSSWVTNTNTNDDRNLSGSFANQTFGFSRMIKGLETAFGKTNEHTFILKLNINKDN